MTQDSNIENAIEEMLSQLAVLRELAKDKSHPLGEDYNNGYADGYAQCIGILNDNLKHDTSRKGGHLSTVSGGGERT
jgi:hypothetical protein